MREADERETAAAARITERLTDAAATVVAFIRAAALVTLGGSALVVEAAQRRLSRAADESERQLDLFAESVRRTTARFWRRRGPHRAAAGRSSRSVAAS